MYFVCTIYSKKDIESSDPNCIWYLQFNISTIRWKKWIRLFLPMLNRRNIAWRVIQNTIEKYSALFLQCSSKIWLWFTQIVLLQVVVIVLVSESILMFCVDNFDQKFVEAVIITDFFPPVTLKFIMSRLEIYYDQAQKPRNKITCAYGNTRKRDHLSKVRRFFFRICWKFWKNTLYKIYFFISNLLLEHVDSSVI